MIQFEDHLLADGKINWTSYRQAQIDNGDICIECGSFIVTFREEGHPRSCKDCKAADNPGELSHRRRIRCPKCKSMLDPYECDSYDHLEDGEHDYTCDDCGYDFKISTVVIHTFTSPPLLEAGDDEDEDQ